MQQIAFTMQLLPGVVDEYRERHDAIWPELVTLLKDAGVHDYSIFHDVQSDRLFAVLRRDDDHRMDELPLQPLMRRWWAAMADLMETRDDNEPVTVPLERVFHLP